MPLEEIYARIKSIEDSLNRLEMTDRAEGNERVVENRNLIDALKLTVEQLKIIHEYDPPIVGDIFYHVASTLARR